MSVSEQVSNTFPGCTSVSAMASNNIPDLNMSRRLSNVSRKSAGSLRRSSLMIHPITSTKVSKTQTTGSSVTDTQLSSISEIPQCVASGFYRPEFEFKFGIVYKMIGEYVSLRTKENYTADVDTEYLTQVLHYLDDKYYNSGDSHLTDEEYDQLRDLYELLVGPYKKIGAEVRIKDVALPTVMKSLKKYTDTKQIPSYGQSVISDKLDGISGLFCLINGEHKLYTRGDGFRGSDISHLIPYIPNLRAATLSEGDMIRGELIIPLEHKEKMLEMNYKSLRNTVAGITNSITINQEVCKCIDFVAYRDYSPRMYGKPLSESFLDQRGLTWVEAVHTIPSPQFLYDYLMKRREASKYEIDGIVVAADVKLQEVTKDSDENSFAFKVQRLGYETRITGVLWRPSQQGVLKPRLQFDPVEIQGTLIGFATAFNAKYVRDNAIGVGTIISLVKGGDVIPHIAKIVYTPYTPDTIVPPLPRGKWTDTGVDLKVDYSQLNDDESEEYTTTITLQTITNITKALKMKYISTDMIREIILLHKVKSCADFFETFAMMMRGEDGTQNYTKRKYRRGYEYMQKALESMIEREAYNEIAWSTGWITGISLGKITEWPSTINLIDNTYDEFRKLIVNTPSKPTRIGEMSIKNNWEQIQRDAKRILEINLPTFD